MYPLEEKGVLRSLNGCAISIVAEGYSVSGLIMINQDVVGLIQVLSLQYVNLVEDFRYKIPTTCLPIKKPPWRDKHQSDVPLLF